MQGFINKEYCVYCPTREEVLAFYELSKQHNLHFTDRWNAEDEIKDYVENATFIYDYAFAPPNDGISFWINRPNPGCSRAVIEFDQLNIASIDVTDFLNFL